MPSLDGPFNGQNCFLCLRLPNSCSTGSSSELRLGCSRRTASDERYPLQIRRSCLDDVFIITLGRAASTPPGFPWQTAIWCASVATDVM